jgi:hypothetical protein
MFRNSNLVWFLETNFPSLRFESSWELAVHPWVIPPPVELVRMLLPRELPVLFEKHAGDPFLVEGQKSH